MYWTELMFGKHYGKTLPQLAFTDPDYLFWALAEGVFNRYGLRGEARLVCQRATHIRILWGVGESLVGGCGFCLGDGRGRVQPLRAARRGAIGLPAGHPYSDSAAGWGESRRGVHLLFQRRQVRLSRTRAGEQPGSPRLRLETSPACVQPPCDPDVLHLRQSWWPGAGQRAQILPVRQRELPADQRALQEVRSEEHTSELQSLRHLV